MHEASWKQLQCLEGFLEEQTTVRGSSGDDALLEAFPVPNLTPKARTMSSSDVSQGSSVSSKWRAAWTQRSRQAVRPSWWADGQSGLHASRRLGRPGPSSPVSPEPGL